MKKPIVLFFSTIVLFSVCSKKAGGPPYTKDSKEYAFFKIFSDSLNVTVLNPDKSNELIRTKEFKVRTGDIMPLLYQRLSRYTNQLQHLPKDQVMLLIQQLAVQRAEKDLLLLTAKENKISVAEDTVQAQLEAIYSNYGGEESFQNQILSQGLTMDFVREDVRDQLIIQNYLNDVLFAEIGVDEQELQDAYQQDKLATVRHILLLTQGKSESEKKEIYKKMEDLLAQARSGKDFVELAKQYSEDPGSKDNGGLYENFARGTMVKPFEEAAFNNPVGSISDIIETRYGYHIVKVISRSKETRPFDEVKGEIQNQIMENKKRNAYFILMESLKENHKYKEVFSAL